jgi:PAS domain-containing protein
MKALQYYPQPDRTRFMQLISDAVEHGLSAPARVTMKTDTGLKTFDLVAARILAKTSPLVVGVMRECPPEADAPVELPNILPGISQAFMSASSAVLITDSKGVVRSANQQFLKLFAIKNAQQIVGRDVRTIANHLGKKLTTSFSDMLSGNAPVRGTLKLQNVPGVSIEVLFELYPLALDHVNGGAVFVGEVADASMETTATEILDTVPTPILVVDLGSRCIKYANKAGRGELGLSAAQIGRERLSDTLLSATDVRDLSLVLDKVGWDAGRVWQVQSHIGLKRHYRIRSCFIGDRELRQVVLEFLPVRVEKDKPANEKAQNFFSRLLEMSFG